MIGWLCIFFPCRWFWVDDIQDEIAHFAGLYQCARCKTISLGAIRRLH